MNGSGVGKEECQPVTGSEDFGLPTQKGCYALIGNGDTTGGCFITLHMISTIQLFPRNRVLS